MNTNSFNCSDTTRHRLLQTVLTGKELVILTIHLFDIIFQQDLRTEAIRCGVKMNVFGLVFFVPWFLIMPHPTYAEGEFENVVSYSVTL